MNAYIYFYGHLNVDRDDIEDALNEVLKGDGEVTGSGAGQSGSNFDITIADESLSHEKIVSNVKEALRDFRALPSGSIVIDGTRYVL